MGDAGIEHREALGEFGPRRPTTAAGILRGAAFLECMRPLDLTVNDFVVAFQATRGRWRRGAARKGRCGVVLAADDSAPGFPGSIRCSPERVVAETAEPARLLREEVLPGPARGPRPVIPVPGARRLPSDSATEPPRE